MNDLFGYHGKVARVNLSNRKIIMEDLPSFLPRMYLGGAGFIAHYLFTEVAPSVDAFDIDNKLIFAPGPVTGLTLPGSARHCVGAISPVTGGIAKSEAGEFWGSELKKCGVDALIIEGEADAPVYIWIKYGSIEIRDAGKIWGKTTKATQEMIRDELKEPKARIAMIGPGGENLVRYACIMHGLFDAAGRGGLGAVMGSKKLKAIAVKGSKPVALANREGVTGLRKWMFENIDMLSAVMDVGTTPVIPTYEKVGDLPVNNYSITSFPEVDKISAQTIRDTIRVGMEGCFACPVRCKKIVEVEGVDSAYGGPEMETLAALGSNCGISDIAAICKGNELCNAYSIDTMSAGPAISFAMECYEHGLLNKTDTGGMDLRFGNSEAMLELLRKIAFREPGLGELLAEGTARAAEEIGGNAADFAMHSKKQDLPMHSPRISRMGGVSYAVAPHGADHCTALLDLSFSGFNPDNTVGVPDADVLGYHARTPFFTLSPSKVALMRIVMMKRTIIDSGVLCLFLPYSFSQLTTLISDITGWKTSEAEMMRIAERVMTVSQFINTQRGFTDDDNTLPVRFFQDCPDGMLKQKPAMGKEEFDDAKQYFYTLMGWDVNGIPLDKKLEELEVERMVYR